MRKCVEFKLSYKFDEFVSGVTPLVLIKNDNNYLYCSKQFVISMISLLVVKVPDWFNKLM